MACPRCGCRMVTKLGRGSQAQLICSDCGLRLNRRNRSGLPDHRTQLITVLLLVVFGATAAGLMTLNDQHQRPSLLQKEAMDLNEVREIHRNPEQRDKRWILVPRVPRK